MNAHYQTYSNLSSPHSPSPDESGSYTTLSSHTAGNSNGVNNGIGRIGGGGGNGGGGGVGNGNSTGGNNGSSGGNGINTNNNNNCNIPLGGSSGNSNVSNTGTSSNHINGHESHTNNNSNNNNLNGASGGGGSTSLHCNSNNMVHHHHLHQNGNHEQHMHNMDNDQPDFHHHLNNNNTNNNNNNNSPIKSCAGCGGKILERYLLHALDRYWHNSCLKCYCCGALLADIGASCYTKAGMILCKSDYTRMFATAPCSSCGQIIAANEFVMRTTIPIPNNQSQNFHQQQQQHLQQQHQPNQQIPLLPENQKPFLGQMEHHVFHLKCFTCSKCASQLRPGDRYYMLAGSLVCEPDWHKLLKNTTQNPPIRKGKVGRPRRTRD